MTRIKFIHPFHNTSVTLSIGTYQHRLTQGQQKKLEKKLCGMSDCKCDFYPVNSSGNFYSIDKTGKIYWYAQDANGKLIENDWLKRYRSEQK